MARKRQTEKGQTIIDLAQEAGLTLMTDATTASDITDWLPTGIPQIDYVLAGGFPYGRISEVYGKNASGKSSLAVALTKQVQKFNGNVVWIDVEATASTENMVKQGADPNKIYLVQPNEGERLTVEGLTKQIEAIIDVFEKTDTPLLLIWDSLAATPVDYELEDDANVNRIGVRAKAIQAMFTKIGQRVTNTNIAFIILNQARDDMSNSFNPNAIKSSGGNALEHSATLRLEVARGKANKSKVVDPITGKDKEEVTSYIFRTKVIKSKVSPANRQAESYLISYPFKGMDFVENIYQSSIASAQSKSQFGLITSGAWREYVPMNESLETVKLRDSEWVPFLQSEEGYPYLEELFLRQMIAVFPHDYAPLHNEHLDITAEPLYAKLKEYYDSLPEDTKEEFTSIEEGEEEVDKDE